VHVCGSYNNIMCFAACILSCYLGLFLLSLYVLYSTKRFVYHNPTGLCLGMDNFNHLVSEKFSFRIVALSLMRGGRGMLQNNIRA
jgi:hypothetical protein